MFKAPNTFCYPERGPPAELKWECFTQPCQHWITLFLFADLVADADLLEVLLRLTEENSWWFLKNLNGEFPYDPAIPHRGIIPKRTENRCSNRSSYADVHSNIMHDSQNVETTPNVHKLRCVYCAVSFGGEKGQTMHATVWMGLENMLCERHKRSHVWVRLYEIHRIGKVTPR